ncbi:MAG TPA: DinB family protein, partial [Anaerolineales bacterium]
MSAEMIRTFVEYHIDMTRRVWDSIHRITKEQFIANDSYSRGSIRNLMVHITRTDQRWLMGLKNLPIP